MLLDPPGHELHDAPPLLVNWPEFPVIAYVHVSGVTIVVVAHRFNISASVSGSRSCPHSTPSVSHSPSSQHMQTSNVIKRRTSNVTTFICNPTHTHTHTHTHTRAHTHTHTHTQHTHTRIHPHALPTPSTLHPSRPNAILSAQIGFQVVPPSSPLSILSPALHSVHFLD